MAQNQFLALDRRAWAQGIQEQINYKIFWPKRKEIKCD